MSSGDNDFDFDELGLNGDEESFTREKQEIDSNTFKQRNDPAPVLERFKLSLLGLYKEKKIVQDEDGNNVVEYKIKKKKATTSWCNRQGAEDIINYIEKTINNHTVQSNVDGEVSFRNSMKFISDDITVHFLSKRETWGVSLADVDLLMASTINFTEFFLRRAIDNKERESYDVGFKETTNRDYKPNEKVGFLQKVAGMFGSRGQ